MRTFLFNVIFQSRLNNNILMSDIYPSLYFCYSLRYTCINVWSYICPKSPSINSFFFLKYLPSSGLFKCVKRFDNMTNYIETGWWNKALKYAYKLNSETKLSNWNGNQTRYFSLFVSVSNVVIFFQECFS